MKIMVGCTGQDPAGCGVLSSKIRLKIIPEHFRFHQG
jgi:hypothetical protein